MLRRAIVPMWLGLCVYSGILPARTATKIDFETDVLPIFLQNCVKCHGPKW